jgi:hypothetical protein
MIGVVCHLRGSVGSVQPATPNPVRPEPKVESGLDIRLALIHGLFGKGKP